MRFRKPLVQARRRAAHDLAQLPSAAESSPKRLLFLIHEIGHFLELFRVAAMLNRTGRYHPVFMFDTAYDAMPEHLKLCSEHGMSSFVSWSPAQPVRMSKLRRIALALWHPLQTSKRIIEAISPQAMLATQRLYRAARTATARAVKTLVRPVVRRTVALKPIIQYTGLAFGLTAFACGALVRRVIPRWMRRWFKRLSRPLGRVALERLLVGPTKRALPYSRPVLAPFRRTAREIAVALSVLRWYRNRIAKIRGLLATHRIDGIVTAEDNVGYAIGVFTKLGRALDLPVVVIPYTIANAKEFAESYFHTPDHQFGVWPNWIVGRVFPHWQMTHRGRRLMRMPGWHVVAHYWFGMAPPVPWVLNSGHADAILVESERTISYYRDAGLVTEKLIAAGALFDDVLAENLCDADEKRDDLYRSLNLPPGRPMILVAVPPNQLPSRPDTGFETYEELLRAWLEPLARATDFNIVVRLHPRIDRSKMAWMEKAGFRIAEADTAALVPLCDLYVASVSATIRWAIACGKPVINYDVFRYRYNDFDGADGVLTVEDYDDYRHLVDRLTLDPASLDEVRCRQQACMTTWGRLDGLSGARILAVFDRLTGRWDDTSCDGLEGNDDEDGHRRNGKNGPAAHSSRQPVAA